MFRAGNSVRRGNTSGGVHTSRDGNTSGGGHTFRAGNSVRRGNTIRDVNCLRSGNAVSARHRTLGNFRVRNRTADDPFHVRNRSCIDLGRHHNSGIGTDLNADGERDRHRSHGWSSR